MALYSGTLFAATRKVQQITIAILTLHNWSLISDQRIVDLIS